MSRTVKTPKPREVIELALRSIKRRKFKGREKESYLLSLLKKNIKKGMEIEDRDVNAAINIRQEGVRIALLYPNGMPGKKKEGRTVLPSEDKPKNKEAAA